MRQLPDIQLTDRDSERVRLAQNEAIRELQLFEILGARVIRDVSLANGFEVEVPHGLGRRFSFWTHGPVRGAATTGRIGELRGRHSGGAPIDASKTLCLQAVGYGATVLVDIVVF